MKPSHSIGDLLAVLATYGSFLTFLPSILSSLAAIGSLIWYGIRIYEYVKSKRVPEINHD